MPTLEELKRKHREADEKYRPDTYEPAVQTPEQGQTPKQNPWDQDWTQAFESIQETEDQRKRKNERYKKLAKYNSIYDGLNLLSQIAGASMGRGEVSADTAYPTGGNTRRMYDRYLRELERGEMRDLENRKMRLQQAIRGQDYAFREGQQRKQHDFQQQQADRQHGYRKELSNEQFEQRKELAEQQAGQQIDVFKEKYDYQKPERDRDAEQEERKIKIAEQRADDYSRGIDIREQQQIFDEFAAAQKKSGKDPNARGWHTLQGPDSENIADLSMNETINLFGFILEKMKAENKMSDDAYDALFSLDRTDATSMKRFVNSHWDKFPETRKFVENSKNTDDPRDPAGIGIYNDENDPLRLFE